MAWLIEMLPGREKVAVGAWLARFPDRSAVKGVAIDMWPPYRDLAREMFPGVPVVVDKFHIVRKANRCMDKVRIRLGKAKPKGLRIHGKRSRHVLNKSPGRLNDQQRFTRDLWLENEPEMKAAYELKEAFYRIFTLPKAEAIAAYDAFPSTVPASLKAEFRELLTPMRNWRTEILAYFDYPITNGYTEAVNGVAKLVNRAGTGYSFPVLRARMLFRQPVGRNWREAPWRPIRPPNWVSLHDPTRYRACQSCGGLFYQKLVKAVTLRPLTSRQKPVTRAACSGCRKRLGQSHA